MWKKYRAYSCLTGIKITLPSHSVVCECFHDCKPWPKNPVPCCKILYTVSSGPYSMQQIVLLQSKCVSHAHQISKCQEVIQKAVCFFVYMLPAPSLDNCFLSGTFVAFYKNWFLSAFLILQAQKQALLLWPASSKHCHKSVQASSSAPLWWVPILSSRVCFLEVFQYFQLCS